jgi:glycosyltransferase involved in cell wall biosynthesis
MKKIKVSIATGNHSKGRGVGIYGESLSRALQKSPELSLTDKNPDLIHYPFFDLFFHTLPDEKGKPVIVTIHDLTPLVLSSRYPKGIHGTINLFRQWLSLRRVTAIITDSQNSKNDIARIFRISPDKIFVTPLAVSDDYQKVPTIKQLLEVKEKYNLPNKFVLTLASGPNPNKNLPSLAEATDRLGTPLVIAGGGMLQEIKGPVHPELIDLVRLQVYNHIIYPGRISNAEFNAMLHMANLYVHPSLYEGFGLPLLEAMTAGCLVVSSNTSSSPEIYHDNAITFNPQKLKSMERAIKKALALTPTQKAKQIDEAREKSKQFSWKKTAKLTLAVYQEVLSSVIPAKAGIH